MIQRDAIEGLIQYISEIKPFHTKIAEIKTIFTNDEDVNIAISENLTMDIGFDKTFAFNETININPIENFKLNTGLRYHDVSWVNVIDPTANVGWDMYSWSFVWSMPVNPFMHITINPGGGDIVALPISETFDMDVNNSPLQTVGIGITEVLNITLGNISSPGIKLSDTVGVAVIESADAVIAAPAGAIIGGFEIARFDTGSYDENLSVLIHLYGKTFPPTNP